METPFSSTIRDRRGPSAQAVLEPAKPKAAQAVVTLDPGLSFRNRPATPQPDSVLNRSWPAATWRLRHRSWTPGRDPASWPLPPPNSATDRSWPSISDPASIKAARANARASRWPHGRSFCGATSASSIEPGVRFDVVCANLTTDLLMVEAERIARWVRPEDGLFWRVFWPSSFAVFSRRTSAWG